MGSRRPGKWVGRRETFLCKGAIGRLGDVRLLKPMVLIAGGAIALLVHVGLKLAGERAPLLRTAPVARPAPTDPAGEPLPDGAPPRPVTTGFSAGTAIDAIAYSPDGGLLASVDRRGDAD